VFAGLLYVPAALSLYSLNRRLDETHSRIKCCREEIILKISGLVPILADSPGFLIIKPTRCTNFSNLILE
jgi:hypothetical protein